MAADVTMLPPGFVLDQASQSASNLPEGFVLDRPEEPEKPRAEQGFLERVREDLTQREERVQEIRQFEQTPVERGLQEAGQTAGAIFDVGGEALVSVGRGISAITPDFIEDPIRDISSDIGAGIVESDIGQLGLQALQEGTEAYQAFKEKYPRAARNLEATVNVGLLVAPVKTPKAAKSGVTPVGKAGERLTAAGKRQAATRKKEFVDDLVLPKQTPTIRAEQAARTTEEGLLRRKTVALTPQQESMAAAVNNLGVEPTKTLQGNYNIISNAVNKEAKSLKRRLNKNDISFPRREFDTRLDAAVARLSENPLITGDAEKTALKIVEKMKQITRDQKSSASGLLEARKKLDSWMRSQKGKTVFDPDRESAISIALREIRNETNDFIDSKATKVAVKKSLKKQSDLLNALDNIAPKTALEANNSLSRLWQKTTSILPLRGEFNQTLAALFGLGGLGASAVFAPFFTKTLFLGLGGWQIGKAVTSPQTKKALGALLKHTDDVIRFTKDKGLISQLRTDRVLLVELLDQLEDDVFTSDENGLETQRR